MSAPAALLVVMLLADAGMCSEVLVAYVRSHGSLWPYVPSMMQMHALPLCLLPQADGVGYVDAHGAVWTSPLHGVLSLLHVVLSLSTAPSALLWPPSSVVHGPRVLPLHTPRL